MKINIKKSKISIIRTLILLITLTSTYLNAQFELPSAKVSPFTYSSNVKAKNAFEVAKMVESYLSNAGRFNMIIGNREVLDAELDLQKDGIYLDGFMVEQNKAIGAQYLVVGHLIDASEGLDYATIQLAIVDVATGSNIAVETLSPKGREAATLLMATDDTSESLTKNRQYEEGSKVDALGSVIKLISKKTLQKNITEFLDEYFPMTYMITNTEEQGFKIINVELYGNKSKTFKKGQYFNVVQRVERKLPTGETATQEKKIATLKVIEVEGDFAQCKVVNKEDQYALYKSKEAKGLAVVKK